MTVTDLLRAHLLESLGMPALWPQIPDLDVLRRTEWCPQFERLMRNRLIMGAFRYGTQEQQAGKQIDRVGTLQRRLDDYKSHGNLEHLVDFAAIAMAEYMHPMHPDAHWDARDDKEHAVIAERK